MGSYGGGVDIEDPGCAGPRPGAYDPHTRLSNYKKCRTSVSSLYVYTFPTIGEHLTHRLSTSSGTSETSNRAECHIPSDLTPAAGDVCRSFEGWPKYARPIDVALRTQNPAQFLRERLAYPRPDRPLCFIVAWLFFARRIALAAQETKWALTTEEHALNLIRLVWYFNLI